MTAVSVTAGAGGGTEPRLLERPFPHRVRLEGDRIWIVQSGYADVFAARQSEGAQAGRRHHLFRATPGILVFGLPASPSLTVEAIGTEATQLRAVTWEAVDEELQNPRTHAIVLRALEAWIDRLCEYIADGMPPANCAGYTAGQDVHGCGCVRPASGVMALELLTGSATVLGRDIPLVEGELIALSRRGWLDVSEGATLRLTALSQIAARGETRRVLARFHDAALAGVTERLGDVAAAERKRYSTRMSSALDASARAFGLLAAVFHRVGAERLAPPPAVSTPHDQLNAACQRVASRLDVAFVKPSATTFRSIKEGVENVARASNFRARHIRLEEGWWRHEQGPLLAFLKESNHAVALLPRPRGGYELVDTDGSPPRRVDVAVAATIAPMGVTFYRPFRADRAIDSLELLRFSVQGCRQELTRVLVSGALVGAIGMGIPIATGVLIDTIIPSTDRAQLTQWTLALIVCTVGTAMFNLSRSIALVRLEMKLGYAIQAAVWDRLISLPARFFRDYSAGDLATRAMGIDSVRQTLSGATIRGALGGVFSVFNFALMFYYDVPLAICGTALIAVAVTVLVTVAYLQRVQQREWVTLQAKKSGVMLQLLTGIRKLRVAGAEMRAVGTWARIYSRQRQAKWRISQLATVWRMFGTTLPLVSTSVLLLVILASSNGSIKTGSFLAFMAAFTACVSEVLNTASAAIGALSVVPQYEMARPILQAAPEISAGQTDPGVLTGEIAMDRVVFGYNTEGPPILHDLSFRIKPGDFVAFVGPSGSGKSTILRLLLGFETPQSGAVSFDNHDLKDLDVRAVRRQIGVVLQSGRLMPGDIYTNIIGCSAATMEDAWAASRQAGFEEDLKRMPMGMHTMVTDGGGTLSGGQRQRLMIARAIVTAPRMLLFDEATSALDNQTQAIVSQSLEQLRATRIVIAHRLSTIVNADQIFVVEKGRIVQSGSYAELMAQPGSFRDLASRQLA
jgi:NHLM bacteriocin system ABC transporter ATP-binding protein